VTGSDNSDLIYRGKQSFGAAMSLGVTSTLSRAAMTAGDTVPRCQNGPNKQTLTA
jgi:hypothetical protein